MKAREVNFDGLVGLTHHYAGLSFGNEASTKHRFQVSNPRLAAKQGLLKMKALADAGFPQAVISLSLMDSCILYLIGYYLLFFSTALPAQFHDQSTQNFQILVTFYLSSKQFVHV